MADSQGMNVVVSGLILVYRPLARKELYQAVQMTRKENWTTTLGDLQLAFEVQANCFYGLFLSNDGRLIGKGISGARKHCLAARSLKLDQ